MNEKCYILIKDLTPEQWNTKVDKNWTVKDVVAHLVGWERESAIQLPRVWITKRKPWFSENKNYDEFNRRSVEQFSKLSPDELLQEWEKWSEKLQEEIEKISEDNLKSESDLFDWVFEEGDSSHYENHIRKIKEVLESR